MAHFERRVTKGGVVRWRAQVRRCGVDATRTFRTKARAREWALQVEAGITGEGRPLGKHTLLEAMRRYAAEVSPTKRGSRWEGIRLKAIEGDPPHALMLRRLDQVTSDELGAWRDRRLKEVAPATARREMNLLASVFETARREWKWVRVNPMRDVRKPTAPPARRRGVKDTELGALAEQAVSEAEREVVAGFELGIESGMRAGEMWGLEREQIDLEAAVAHLTITKNGDARDVALSERAVVIITALLADGRPTLFTISNAVRDTIFRRLRDAAGVPDLHFHDSRSEAAWRLSKKLPIQELADQFGWRDLNSLLFYYKPSAADRAMRLRDVPQTTARPPRRPSGASRSRRSRG